MRTLRLRVALGVLVVLTVGASTLAFASAFTTAPNEPRSGWVDGLYASLQLFTVSMERHEIADLPVVVNVARFVAPLLTLGAVYVALFDFTARLRDRRAARRLTGHHVVCGGSSEAVSIANALTRLVDQQQRRRFRRRGAVVLIASKLDGSTVDRARALGVSVLVTTPGSAEFESALNGASAVTICGVTDRESIEWAVAADHAGEALTAVASVLMRRPEHALHERGQRFRFTALDDRVAHGVVAAWPFRPAAASESVAIVVGAGAGARSLAQRLSSSGSRRLGHRVVAVMPPGDRQETNDLVSVAVSPSASISDLAATIEGLSAGGSVSVGDPMYVWSGDHDRDLTYAIALAGRFPASTVIAVLPSAMAADLTSSAWPNVHVIGVMDALVSGHLLANTNVDRLARALADERRLFGGSEFAACEGRHALDVLDLGPDGLVSLASNVLASLEELGVTVDVAGVSRVMFAPEEIRFLAFAIAGDRVSRDDRVAMQPFMDLAARVPQLLDLASIPVAMSEVALDRVRLDWESAERIAQAIGANYRRRTGGEVLLDTGQASAADLDQALDFPTKLAASGLRFTRDPKEPTPSLSDEMIEMLAEFEHQRWCRQRREWGWTHGEVRDNELRRHPDLIPWSELSESSKEKDRGPIREIGEVLSEVGLNIAT